MDIGEHNQNLQQHQVRLLQGGSYEDLSTIHLMLTRGLIPVSTVECLLTTLPEMNQRKATILATGHSCMGGYNAALEEILKQDYQSAVHKQRPFRFLFVTEDDVEWPSDALLQLYRAIKQSGLDGVSGLCWTKMPNGHPMILGDPASPYTSEYFAQVPQSTGIQECKAIPLGCTLLRLDMFRDPRMKKPFFREDCGLDGEPGGRCTVDVYFWHQARKLGYRCGVLADLKVGHRDPVTGRVF